MKEKEDKIDKMLKDVKKKEEKIKSFSELLEGLASTDEKKKSLWKEIYENAVGDRERASILFTEAYKSMGASPSDHIAMGSIMSKYLERMSKSNDQILNLAELVNKAEKEQEKIVPDELYSKILGD